jgi:arylsulfatase A-like enzyme
MRKTDVFVVATWAAVLFGLLEGTILCLTRAYPAIHAAHKVSPDILWVAPAVELFLFLLAALGLFVLLQLPRGWLTGSRLLRACLVLVVLGVFTALAAPALLHPVGTALFTLVLAAAGVPILVELAHRRAGASALLVVYGLFAFVGITTAALASGVLHPLSGVVLSLGLSVGFCRQLRGAEGRVTAVLRRGLLGALALPLVVGLGVFGSTKAGETARFRQLPPARKQAANVLVIVLDTVRSDRFERPAEQSLTPHLDRLAAGGTRFVNAWSPSSWSLPTQASILAGLYPHEHGADWPDFRAAADAPWMSEFFAQRGYVSGAFSGNAAWITPEYLGRGFLRFDVYRLEDLLRRTVPGRAADRLLCKVGYHAAGRGKQAPEVNAQFLRFLDDYPGRPFFAYLCYMDVNQTFHDCRFNYYPGQYAPTPEVVAAYDRGLRTLDGQVAALFAELRRRGLLENTVVVVTSDHGESFGAAETTDHDPPGHGTSLYLEQTRVPLFVVYPGKVPAGLKIDQAVSTRAIPATITRLLGLRETPFTGEPLPLGPAPSSPGGTEAAVLATLKYGERNQQSVTWNNWHYITDLKPVPQTEELYDLATDALAKNNLTSHDSVLALIRHQLEYLLSGRSQTAAEGPRNPENR